MKYRRFLLALIVAGAPLAGMVQASAAPPTHSDYVLDKSPRPTPKPGPRGGGDDD